LKIDGIDGESHDHKHKGEIELQSYSLGATQQGTASSNSGLGAGKVNMHDMQCVAGTSKASPTIMHACTSGEHYKKATLVARKAGKEQQEYLTITLTDVLVSSYQHGGTSHGSDIPNDHFALNFAAIDFEVKEQKHDGTLGGKVKKGWDVKANKTKA
jgi:type VI secretion system secreted protein Hcp